MPKQKESVVESAEDAVKRRNKNYPKEIEEALKGKSSHEKARILAMANSNKRWGRSNAVITSAHLDDNLSFIVVPDIVHQWALQRPGYAGGKILSNMGFEGVSKTSFLLWLANLTLQQGGDAAGVFLEHADSTTHQKNYIQEKFLDIFPCYIAETLEEGIEMSYQIQRDWEFIDEYNLRRKKEIKERLKTKVDQVEADSLQAELSILLETIKRKFNRLEIFDSVGGATQEKLLEDEFEPGSPKPGGIGAVMADFTNSMKTRCHRTRTLWGVNGQAREVIDIGFKAMLPKPEIEKLIAKGGRAIPFHASYVQILKKGSGAKDEDKNYEGFNVTMTFKKNKYGVPMRQLEYGVRWGKGLQFQESTMSVLTAGKVMGLMAEKVRGEGLVYYSKEMGIPKDSSIPEDKMYELIHTPEWMFKFQKALGIITDVNQTEEVPDSEAYETEESIAKSLETVVENTQAPVPINNPA